MTSVVEHILYRESCHLSAGCGEGAAVLLLSSIIQLTTAGQLED